MNAAIFLDRDNTLIYADGDVADPSQVRLLQGVPSAIASLRGLGYKIIVVTNQDGIANGRYTEQAADAVHMKINEQIGNISGTSIDRFYYCPFHPDAILERYRKDHPWRKPNPGMIAQAAKDLDIDLTASWIISTDPADVKTGYAGGVRTMLLTSKAEDMIPLKLEEIFIQQTRALVAKETDGPYFTARSLVEAVRVIAQQRRPDFPEERVVRDRFGRKITAGDTRPKPQLQGEAPTPLFTGAMIEPPPVAEPAQEAPAPVTPPAEPESIAVAVQQPTAPVEPEPVATPIAVEPEPVPVKAAEPATPAAVEREPMLIPMPELEDNSDDEHEPVVIHEKPEPELKEEETVFAHREDDKAAEPDPEPEPEPTPVPVAAVPKPAVRSAAPATPKAAVKPAPAPVAAAPVSAEPEVEPIDVPEIEKLPPVEVQFQRMESSLRQILHEIRSSKEVVTEMSFSTIIGLVLQMLSIILLAGGLFHGGEAFTRWVACAIVLQLASITAVLIKR